MAFAIRKDSFGFLDEGRGIICNGNKVFISIGMHDITNGSGDYTATRSQILWCLGWADKAGGVIPGERKDRNVPARHVFGQVIVSLAAEIEYIRTFRQTRRVDLH